MNPVDFTGNKKTPPEFPAGQKNQNNKPTPESAESTLKTIKPGQVVKFWFWQSQKITLQCNHIVFLIIKKPKIFRIWK